MLNFEEMLNETRKVNEEQDTHTFYIWGYATEEGHTGTAEEGTLYVEVDVEADIEPDSVDDTFIGMASDFFQSFVATGKGQTLAKGKVNTLDLGIDIEEAVVRELDAASKKYGISVTIDTMPAEEYLSQLDTEHEWEITYLDAEGEEKTALITSNHADLRKNASDMVKRLGGSRFTMAVKANNRED